MLVWKAPMDMVSHGKWKYGGKRNKLYFLFGNHLWYIYAWKVLGTLSRFCWWDGYTSQNVFISTFSLWALAPLQIPTSLCEGPIFYFMQIFFEFESPSSLIKAPTRRQYDRAQVLGVVNIRVCFMNGSMFEHDGLGITYFSIDILKDMVACWYAWVSKLSCQN